MCAKTQRTSKNDIKITDLEALWGDINNLKTIGEWKKRVEKFRLAFNLSDKEAINLANKRF